MSEHSMQFVSVAKLHSLLEVNVFGYEIMLTCVSQPTTWSLVSCNHQKQKKCVGEGLTNSSSCDLSSFFFFPPSGSGFALAIVVMVVKEALLKQSFSSN